MIHTFAENGAHSPSVTRNRARKMREILGVALDLATEGGLDNLTLHRLADRMGRSVAAVYRYFPSREAVIAELQRLVVIHIRALLEDAQSRLDAWATETNLSKEDHLLATLLTSGLAYEAYAHTAPGEYGLVTRYLSTVEYVLPERDAVHVFSVAGEGFNYFASQIEAAEKSGLLIAGPLTTVDGTSETPRDRAVMFWAALQGSIDAQKVVRRGGWALSPSLTRDMIVSLVAGWGGDHKRLRELAVAIENEGLAAPRLKVDALLGPNSTYSNDVPSDADT